MLVSLSISYWTGKASDDSVVDELTKSHSTKGDVHDYRKRLVSAEAVNEFKAVRSRARSIHLEMTMPWIDGGTRILPAQMYMDYAKKVHALHTEYEEKVAEFIKKYPSLKAEAKQRLGTLYSEADYPSAESLRRKFGWEMHVFPIPSRQDWRVNMGAADAKIIQDKIEAQVIEAMSLATRDLWKRLHEVIKALAEKLHDADSKFRDSIIGNIRDLVGLLPMMNVTNDPALEEMRKKVEIELCSVAPDSLRDDPKARKKTADAADAILATMGGYIGETS